MRLKLFGVAVFLLSSAFVARADELYTVSFSGAGSGTYTFIEPSILTSPFTVNAADLTSSVQSGDVLTEIDINPANSESPTADGCFAVGADACVVLHFSLPTSDTGAIVATFHSPLTAPGSFVFDGSTGQDISISIEPTAAATPEPSSLALLGTGVLGFAGVLRKRLACR